MTIMRTPEEILDAYGRFLMPDSVEEPGTQVEVTEHGALGWVAAQYSPEAGEAVYAWLCAALGAHEAHELYRPVMLGMVERAVAIDPDSGSLMIVDRGVLMEARAGDWIVYVEQSGFCVFSTKTFQSVWGIAQR